MAARMTGRRLQKKERLKTYLKKINLVFGEAGEAIRMLRLIPERTTDIDEEVFAHSIDWQKCKYGQISAYTKAASHRLARKKTVQQRDHCVTEGLDEGEDWKRS
jgi:ribonuclease PH